MRIRLALNRGGVECSPGERTRALFHPLLSVSFAALGSFASMGGCCDGEDCCPDQPEHAPGGTAEAHLYGKRWPAGPLLTWSLDGTEVAQLDCSSLPSQEEGAEEAAGAVWCENVSGGQTPYSWGEVRWEWIEYHVRAEVDVGSADPPVQTAELEIQWSGGESEVHLLGIGDKGDANEIGCSVIRRGAVLEVDHSEP